MVAASIAWFKAASKQLPKVFVLFSKKKIESSFAELAGFCFSRNFDFGIRHSDDQNSVGLERLGRLRMTMMLI